MTEEQIDLQKLEPAMNHISSKNEKGTRQMRREVSDDELRAFIRECKRVADEAQVPDEPYEVQIGEEFKKAVDRALNNSS